jgi:hypothetical protein
MSQTGAPGFAPARLCGGLPHFLNLDDCQIRILLAAETLLKPRPEELSWGRRSRIAPGVGLLGGGGWLRSHPAILRPQGFDPLTDIAVIDVAAVDFEEVVQCRGPIACALP